jgi:hypothetical protein
VRLVGHDFMDFRKDQESRGGADGCLDFSDPDNIGLETCLQNSKLNEIYAKHCGTVSRADFFVIAAEAVMGRTSSNYDANNRFSD